MVLRSLKVVKKYFSLILPAVLFLFATAQAQYFGRNKVTYDNFDFKVLHTEHFDIYYYPEEKEGVNFAARLAERWYKRHSVLMDDTLMGKQTLILYDGFPQFSETNVTQGQIGQGTGGFTEPVMRRVVLPFAGPLDETSHVIGHELVHAFQFDVTSKRGDNKGGFPAAAQMPLWFIEGMAEYFSLGPDDPNTAMWMREATLKKLPDISDLNNPKYFPYRYGQSLLAFMGGKWGDYKIIRLLRVAAHLGSMNAGIDSVYHIKPDSISKEWHQALHAAYDSLAKVTAKPGVYGKELISEKQGGGEMNLSPALSPDGSKLVFFSSKDLFAMDLYLADAKTGKVEKNIFRSELNTHLQNLEFINSAGAWNPDGKQFVFAGTVDSRPILTIIDVDNGKEIREIKFPKLAEIFNPAWSPDGRYIAFSALANGLSDLFMYDLKTDSLKRLTNDPYADLQPEFSPDGKTIAFVTDRFTTNLSDLKLGNYQLALYNVESGNIQSIGSFKNAKNINPQWSPDGKSIYFLSDRNGITNIYKLDMNSGTINQVTNLFGGVSGITGLSPALSVAANSNYITYSVFDDGKYDIFSIDSLNVMNGTPVVPQFAFTNPGQLPPLKRFGNVLTNNLNDPNFGLPADTNFQVTDYHPTLRLSGVGQPSVGAGVDQFGTYVGGGVALFWSDLLGDYNLSTALQIESGNGITNIFGFAGYMNTKNRWNWGGIIQQVPYYITGYNVGYGTINGTPAYITQQYIYKETDREVSGLLAYPFNQSLRVEFSAGYRNISFDNEVTTQATSLYDGSVLINNTQALPHDAALNLATLDAALVFDNSYFGATSPLLGTRFRIDAQPVIGSLNWTNILLDFRQYFLPIKPFTIALRILHAGRYGKGADDGRLSPLFLGYPGLVRGYDSQTFTNQEYADTTAGSLLDKLFGSKLLITNLELRFPLFGVLGLGSGYYGYFPIELAAFYDAGVAWTNTEKAWFLGGNQKPVRSYGAAIRINLFGYAVGEVDYVRPLDRQDVGWLWEFNLTEGF
ncbi:MAG: peptidase S9 [Ignavibacteriaceae bacterium]